MAGFACLIDRRGRPIGPEIVDRVARSLDHRGPDGVTSSVNGSIALIHGALNATPESLIERQPFAHPRGVTYVGDVRLDNRSELMDELHWSRPAAETSDIELVAAAHERWGREAANHLLGDFAFVAVDRTGRLECYRDQMGIKPVFYCCSSEWFVVASELRQIRAVDGTQGAIDVGMAGEYLSGVVEDSVRTIVAGVDRLPAAHRLEFDDVVRTERYWRPALDDPIVLPTRGDYIEQFRDLLDRAVECRVRAVGPIGSQFSGGIDSTSITAQAARRYDDVLALSCFFPGAPRSDERPFIDAAVGHLGVRWEPVFDVQDRGPWVEADVAFWSDIPIPPDGPAHVELGRRVAAKGGRVVLTGHGGDHWLDASPYILFELLAARRFSEAWRTAAVGRNGSRGKVALTLLGIAARSYKPDWVRRPGGARAPWVAGAARAEAKLDQRRVPSRGPRAYRSRRAQVMDQINSSGYEAMTRLMLDRIAARAGVEARHPYLDRRIMEFAARIPASVHSEVGRNRTLQRDALTDLLPPTTTDRRSKAAFSEVWWQEIQRHTPSSGFESGRLARLGWIDERETRHAVEQTAAIMGAGAGAGQSLALWGLVQIEALVGHLAP